MLFRLSLAWGLPVATICETLSADELNDWQAYYSIEPWGCMPDDIRAAIQAHTTACCFSTKSPKFADFLPKWEPPKPVSYQDGAKAFAAAFGVANA